MTIAKPAKELYATQVDEDEFDTFFVCLQLFLIFVGIDTISTACMYHTGYGIELNPIMDYFLKKSILLFAVVKLIIGLGGAFLLRKTYFDIRARLVIYFSTLVYGVVGMYHIFSWLEVLT